MLERIEIENLGSIQKAGVSLSPLTVLLGANASGKTTVMRGIELFAMLRNQPWQEIRYAGNWLTGPQWSKLIHRGDTARRLVFRGSVQPGATGPDYEMRLGIDWEQLRSSIVAQADTEKQAEPELLNEKLRDPKQGWIITGTEPQVLTAREFPPSRSHGRATPPSRSCSLNSGAFPLSRAAPGHCPIPGVLRNRALLPPEQLGDAPPHGRQQSVARRVRVRRRAGRPPEPGE